MEVQLGSNAQAGSDNTFGKQYDRLAQDRDPYLRRARACSALTIPTLILPEGATPQTALPTPYQSHGARGVNTLASKLMLTMLPPNRPFVKMKVSEQVRAELGKSYGEVEQAMQAYVQTVMDDFEGSATRPFVVEANKHLLVSGNVLLYDDPKANLRLFPLTQYVCKRKPDGSPQLVIIHEKITRSDVPEEILGAVDMSIQNNVDKDINLHTKVEWNYKDGKVEVSQEIAGVPVPDSQGSFPIESCPFLPLRMIPVSGESYGRSYVEEYIGDLKSLELLNRYLVHGAAAAAKIVFLANPNGVTRARDFARANGGDVITGVEGDITAFSLGKYGDFRTVMEKIKALEEALGYAFLLNSAIQRNGERVTAEEIRYMAEELEAQLGGVYSMLSLEFQLPLYRSRVAKMSRKGTLAKLPDKAVRPTIATGLDAIGRGNEYDNLNRLGAMLRQNLGEQAAATMIHKAEYGQRAANSLGIKSEGLIKTADELDQDAQNEQQAQAMQAMAGPAVNQLGRMATSSPAAPQAPQ